MEFVRNVKIIFQNRVPPRSQAKELELRVRVSRWAHYYQHGRLSVIGCLFLAYLSQAIAKVIEKIAENDHLN